MKKLELTENQANGILLIVIILLVGIGIVLGIGIEKINKCDYFYVSKYQTRGDYLHLPNGTLWKKVKEVKND